MLFNNECDVMLESRRIHKLIDNMEIFEPLKISKNVRSDASIEVLTLENEYEIILTKEQIYKIYFRLAFQRIEDMEITCGTYKNRLIRNLKLLQSLNK